MPTDERGDMLKEALEATTGAKVVDVEGEAPKAKPDRAELEAAAIAAQRTINMIDDQIEELQRDRKAHARILQSTKGKLITLAIKEKAA